MKNQQIWFVIVTYKPDTAALLRLKKAFEDRNIIIVDNTEKNIGYGARANEGMRNAFAAGARWVVVCNQDILVSKRGITQLCAIAQHCVPGIVAPEAGTLDPKRWTTELNERRIEFHRDLYISGSMMAIHNDVWQATGGFFEPYFMYYEDVDLSVRAKKAGFPLRQVALDGFRHGSMEKRNNRQEKEYYLARNHLLFVRRLAPVSVKVHEFLRLPKTIAQHHIAGNTDAIRGISDFAIGRFGEEISQGQAFQK